MQEFLQSVLGVLQWTVAIGSAIAALALFTWIIVLFLKKDRRNEHVKMTVRYDDMPLKIQGNNEILDFVIHDDEGNYLLIEGASNVPYFGESAATCQKHFLKYIS